MERADEHRAAPAEGHDSADTNLSANAKFVHKIFAE